MIDLSTLVILASIVLIWSFAIGAILRRVVDHDIAVDGNGPTLAARRALRTAERRRRRTAIDHYQLGALYDYHFGDTQRAQHHYQRALERAAAADRAELAFLIDRVGDRMMPRMAEPDEYHRDMDIAEALQHAYDAARAVVAPAAVVAAWHTDTQNVHDTLLSDTLVQQYSELKRLNRKQGVVDAASMNDIIRSLQQTGDATESAIQMLAFIRDHDATVVKLQNDTEPRLVQEVWAQAVRTPDGVRSFVGNLEDSWNGGSPVCVTGRISRVLSSLAHIVPEAPQLGVLKTREAVRNEIFNEAGKILDAAIDRAQLRDVWALDDPDAEQQRRVDDVKSRAKLDITSMIKRYDGIDHARIEAECFAAID